MNKIVKPRARLLHKERESTLMDRTMNEHGLITTKPSEIQTIVRDHDVKLHANRSAVLEDMDKFLNTHSMPDVPREETENLKTPIPSEEMESVVKNLATDTSPGPDVFPGGFFPTLNTYAFLSRRTKN